MRYASMQSSCTFKCEGCGQRFPAARIWAAIHNREAMQAGHCVIKGGHGLRLLHYVCSKTCHRLASHQKTLRGETAMRLIAIEQAQYGEGAQAEPVVRIPAVPRTRALERHVLSWARRQGYDSAQAARLIAHFHAKEAR